jgi:VanZ family protein
MKPKFGLPLFVAYGLVVAVASLQPASGINMAIGSFDKLAHLLTYGIFAALAYRLALSYRRYVWLCIGIVIYSGLLEYGQSFVPGRDMSSLDLVANGLGVLIGTLICLRVFGTGSSHGVSQRATE